MLKFYALSPAAVELSLTPAVVTRSVVRHTMPVFRLSRLAVDQSMPGQGLGGHLLLAAAWHCRRASQEVWAVALLIEAKNMYRVCWHLSYAALPLLDAPLALLMLRSTAKMALEATGKWSFFVLGLGQSQCVTGVKGENNAAYACGDRRSRRFTG